MNAALRAAYDSRRKAEKHLQEVIRRELPAGTIVQWERAGHLQFGKVTRHTYGDNLFVHNIRTRNEVKISVGDIARGAELARDKA